MVNSSEDTSSRGISRSRSSSVMAGLRRRDMWRHGRARSSLDRTHNLQMNAIFQLPFGQGKKFANNRVASAVLGGWQLNALLSMYTGQPFNITAPGTSLNAPGNTQRADQIKPEVLKLGGIGSAQPFYDPAAFAQVTAVRFGTAGFYVLDSPGTVNLDSGIFRSFQI